MSSRPELALRRTRESTSKVRTGCSTCKARRVKCDEGKPICQRCASGGRTCEYTTIRPALRPRDKFTIYLPPTKKQPTFFVNQRGTDFFHFNLAANLDGQFESQFWSKLVLQLSHSEPSIRHAISAISIIYEDVELCSRYPAGNVDANPKAQQEWNKAIKSLAARIEAHPNSNLVPLVCCLLFTCIEFLKGNFEDSMLHVGSGFGILAALRQGTASLSPVPSGSSTDLMAIEHHIVPIFSRLRVLCSLSGRATPPIRAPMSDEDSPHESLTDSRQRLLEISNACLEFISVVSVKAEKFEVDIHDVIQQFKLQTRLNTWHAQLNKLMDRLGDSSKQESFNLLMVHYKSAHIWLHVCIIPGEMATDSYHSDFQELVEHAEKVANPTKTPQLSFDLHILGPLFYTALKCRYPATRRRALEMLQLAPRREFLWNGHYAYVTAKRVIELEEKLLNDEGLPDETARVHGLNLPGKVSLKGRSDDLPCELWKPNNGLASYPGALETEFLTKPWGLAGEWHSLKERIEL